MTAQNRNRPIEVRLSRAKGWKKPDNTVSVARPSPWGNPFIVGVSGTAAECVTMFRYLLAGYICLTAKVSYDTQLKFLEYAKEHIEDLRGKNLACWCNIGAPCHRRVLLEVANAKRTRRTRPRANRQHAGAA